MIKGQRMWEGRRTSGTYLVLVLANKVELVGVDLATVEEALGVAVGEEGISTVSGGCRRFSAVCGNVSHQL
jgi:hypothetical protein